MERLVPSRRRHDVEVVRGPGWSVRVHRPDGLAAAPVPALLWIHGGGYVIGTAAQDDALCRHFASELGAVVAAVDYRRAPSTPSRPHSRTATTRSSGWPNWTRWIRCGSLSAARAPGAGWQRGSRSLALERQQVTPILQLLTYPMLDDRTALRDDIDERGFRLWNNRSNELGWRSYLAVDPGSDDVSHLASPARGEDLSGLAPAWLGVGTLDLFHDEDLAYAERLRASGVPCDLEVVPGAFHAFDRVAPRSNVARRFQESQLRSLAAAFAGVPR